MTRRKIDPQLVRMVQSLDKLRNDELRLWRRVQAAMTRYKKKRDQVARLAKRIDQWQDRLAEQRSAAAVKANETRRLNQEGT